MPKGYKFKVTQEYEVILFYEQGVVGDNQEDQDEQIISDVLELADNHEGLVVSMEDDNEGVNTYIGLVTTFDPIIEEMYNTETMPNKIKTALAEKGFKVE